CCSSKRGARRGKTNESRQQLLGRAALIHERPGFRSLHVAGFDGIDPKPGDADQIVSLAVEMAAAADPSPAWRQPVLPASNRDFRRQTCSTKSNCPPGLRTRRISISAATGSAIEHNVHVITIVSNTAT